MGTYTADGHFYKPGAHESNYETAVNLNWDVLGKLGSGVANVMDPQFAGGAKGDGTTNDSAAIQAAITSNAATVVVPGVLAYYRIDTPLIPKSGQLILGAGGTHTGYGSKASRFKVGGANTVIWDVQTDLNLATFKDLVMEGTSETTSDNTTAFRVGSGAYIGPCRFLNCSWNWTKWSFNLGSTGWFLSNWFDACRFVSAPIQLGTGTNQYSNNNHWTNCQWQLNSWPVPAVDIQQGNPAGGIFFSQCYFESMSRQCIRVLAPHGLGVRETYFEAINLDGATYTAKDGRTRPLPAIDIINKVGTAVAKGIVIENNQFVGDGAQFSVFGSSAFPAGFNNDLSFGGNAMGGMVSGNGGYASWDASAFRRVQGVFREQVTFDDIGIYPNNFTGGIMPVHDAHIADTWFLAPVDTTNFTIPNPTSQTQGRRVRYIIFNDGGALGTISWGSNYQFVAATAPAKPASNKKTVIEFEYNGTDTSGGFNALTGKWVETNRLENIG